MRNINPNQPKACGPEYPSAMLNSSISLVPMVCCCPCEGHQNAQTGQVQVVQGCNSRCTREEQKAWYPVGIAGRIRCGASLLGLVVLGSACSPQNCNKRGAQTTRGLPPVCSQDKSYCRSIRIYTRASVASSPRTTPNPCDLALAPRDYMLAIA